MSSGSYWASGADAFTSDVYFAGGDGGRSIDLLDGRVLWEYGDSFIRTTPGQARSAAAAVHNSVSIQSGSYDLSDCTMTFYCAGIGTSTPSSFFPERAVDGAPVWNWPGPGLVLDDVLLLLLSRIEPSLTGFGFSNVGWDAVLVDNPSAAPSAWKLNYLDTPSDRGLTYPGSMQDPGDGWVYAQMAGEDLAGRERLYAIRWDRDLAKIGDVMSPQYWRGSKFGWTYDEPARQPIFSPSVVGGGIVERTSDVLVTETPSFGGANYVAYAVGRHPTGPFSREQRFFRPYGSDPNLTLASSQYLVYGGEMHPEQTWEGKEADDMLCTYAVNAAGSNNVRTDESIYWVRPVKGLALGDNPRLPTSVTFPSRVAVANG